MVAPIRDLGNKFTSTTLNTIPTQTFELPTMSYSNNIEINIFARPSPNNFDEVKGRSHSTKGNISRDSSMSSTKSSITYHKKMECNNAMVVNDKMDDISPALFYETDQEKVLRVSKAAEQQINMRFKHGKLISSKLTPNMLFMNNNTPTLHVVKLHTLRMMQLLTFSFHMTFIYLWN